MINIQGKNLEISISNKQDLCTIARALSNPVRVDILSLLSKKNMSVAELALALDVPMSTISLSVSVLEEAGLIAAELQPGKRGSMKLCSSRLDNVSIKLVRDEEVKVSTIVMEMPIGGFSSAEGIEKTCGIATKTGLVGEMDDEQTFYMPQRLNAQLIWFRQGMLEYRFSHTRMKSIVIDFVELSFEACSEAPLYRDPWKSDISVYINNVKLGEWTSPCDCGGRRGKFTPDWWSELSTQFGFLKTWRVTREGTYLDGAVISNITVDDLHLQSSPFIGVRIGLEKDAANSGGINLFGASFGDFPQGIVMRLGYHMGEQ